MAENYEDDEINNLVRDLDDFLQGRYYLTLYCKYSHAHTRVFHSKRVKRSLYHALVFTILLQLMEALYYHHDAHAVTNNNSNFPYPHNIFLRTQFADFVDANTLKDHGTKSNFANPRTTLHNGKKTLRPAKGHVKRGYTMSFKRNDTNLVRSNSLSGNYWWFKVFAGFVLRYMLVTSSYYVMFHIIPGLTSILHNIYVRHTIARSKSNLILGLFRMQRVTRSRD